MFEPTVLIDFYILTRDRYEHVTTQRVIRSFKVETFSNREKFTYLQCIFLSRQKSKIIT